MRSSTRRDVARPNDAGLDASSMPVFRHSTTCGQLARPYHAECGLDPSGIALADNGEDHRGTGHAERVSMQRRGTMQRAAIVTGASRGIGAAVAERLAKDGFPIVVNYAGSEAEAAAVAGRIKTAGGRAVAVQGDVGKAADVKRLFDAGDTEFGGVDVLVNNAGIMSLV